MKFSNDGRYLTLGSR
jgi:hypothetical protein